MKGGGKLASAAVAVACALAGITVATEHAAATSAPAFFYRVSNGNATHVLEALVDGRSAAAFYDYENGDSSSHTGYEQSNTLSIFLWSGPEGKSLVFMADKENDGSGGSLKVNIAGLPSGAAWTVKDDASDTYSASSATWAWIACCTDGGVMGLGTSGAISLNLTFSSVSGLSTFRLFGGPASAPQFVAFDRTLPLVIETFQTPGAPSLSGSVGPGAGELELVAAAPADDGGDPVTSYRFYQVEGAARTLVGSSADGILALSGLPDGATRSYAVRAVNRGGEGNESSILTLTTLDVPSAPRALAAVAGPGVGEASLVWDAPASDGGAPVTGYVVMRDGETVATLGDVLTYRDGALANGATHTYAVAAVNLVGTGTFSDAASATTFDLPSAPATLSVNTGPGVGELSVAWSPATADGGTPVTAYELWRDGVLIATLEEMSYVDAGLGNGATHAYAVAAVNLVGSGPATGEVSGTTMDVPSAPLDLQAESGPDLGETTLTWSPPANDHGAPVALYLVYGGASPDEMEYLGSSNQTRYVDATDEAVPLPQARYYAVSAVNLVGEGPRSASVCGLHAPWGALGPLACARGIDA